MIEEQELVEDWDDPEEEVEPPSEKLRIRADRGQEPLRVDKFLMNRIEGATRNKLQQAMEQGLILVNGDQVKPNYKIKAGDEVVVFDYRKPESTEIVAERMVLDIRHEDDQVLLIHKPAGLVVHPGCGNY